MVWLLYLKKVELLRVIVEAAQVKVDGHGQAKVLTSDEIGKLFEALEGDRDRTLFGICLYTGCRISEACSILTTNAYDAAGVRAKLTLRKANTKGKQETRQIPVNSVLKGYLETYHPGA